MLAQITGRNRIRGTDTPPDVTLYDDPAYAAEVAKLTALRTKMQELNERLDALRAENVHGPAPAKGNRVGERLDALGEFDDAALERALSNGTGRAAAGRRAADIQRINDQRASVSELAGEQYQRTERAKTRAARALAEVYRPAYTALLEQMAGAAVELGRLADREAEFRRAMEAQHVSALPPAGLHHMRLFEGEGSNAGSKLTNWLEELKRNYGIKVPR
jgi:hypothetical protein